MTISTDRTQEFTVDQICLLAYRTAGLLSETQTMSVAKAANARQYMQLVLQKLETQGLFARTTVFTDIALVAGTYAYALDSSIVNVTGVAQYVVAATDVDRRIAQIAPEQWASLPAKDASGAPSVFYLERSNMTVYLNPVPDAAAILRLQVQRLRATSLTGTDTPDVERGWSEYLRLAVAHELALSNSRNLALCGYIATQAQNAYSAACVAARGNLETQFYPG